MVGISPHEIARTHSGPGAGPVRLDRATDHHEYGRPGAHVKRGAVGTSGRHGRKIGPRGIVPDTEEARMAGRWRRLAVVAALAMLGGGVAPAGADDAVEWRAIDASALLDRDGVLHVSERITVAAQGPVVAERWFREWRRSRVTLASVGRLDPRTGALSPLTAGSPDAAGVYSFQDGVLKWSVGQPAGDAGEAGNVEVYQIEYTVPAIVPIWGVRRFSPRTVLAPFAMDPRRRAEELWQGWRMAPGGLLRRYLLDFGFSPFPVNAGGPVGRFSLELRVDPAWRLLAVPIPRSGPIAADDDLRDFLPLDFVGPGAPSAGLHAYHALWVAPLVVMPILSLVLVGSCCSACTRSSAGSLATRSGWSGSVRTY